MGDQIAEPVEPDAGEVRLEGSTMVSSWRREARTMRRRIQLVMQDPWDALSPRLTVEEMVREPLDLDRDGAHLNASAEVAEALESVGLPSSGSFLRAHTHELSGGQLQRIALARALIVRPKLLVTDQPTSMLDASEQARLLVALRERHVEMGLGLVLISHDMAGCPESDRPPRGHRRRHHRRRRLVCAGLPGAGQCRRPAPRGHHRRWPPRAPEA